MLAAWRLRCLSVLLLIYCTLADVDGSSSWPSARGQDDRRNAAAAANKHRRSTTSDPHEPPTSPQLSLTTPVAKQRFPVPWVSDAGDTARQRNSVKVTRKSTKARRFGMYAGHMAVMETSTLPLVTHRVMPSEVEMASAEADGSKRLKPGGGKTFAITRTTAETTEPTQREAEASIPQRILRVKTATAATSTTAKTTRTTPLTTTKTKQPVRKHTTAPAVRGRSTSNTTYGNRTTSKSSSAKDEGCSRSCEMHRCETVEAEMCQGRVVKDRCNCCPVCLVEPHSTNEWREDVTTKKPTHHTSNACDGMQCPKHKVCILNIQGIPMCRCPNIYSCRGLDRNPLCAQNEVTYKNKCFLKVEECTVGHRIRIDHRGSCRGSKPAATVQLETPDVMSITSRFDPDHRTQEATHRKSGKNDPWRHAATDSDKLKSTKMRKRHGSKSQFPQALRLYRF